MELLGSTYLLMFYLSGFIRNYWINFFDHISTGFSTFYWEWENAIVSVKLSEIIPEFQTFWAIGFESF